MQNLLRQRLRRDLLVLGDVRVQIGGVVAPRPILPPPENLLRVGRSRPIREDRVIRRFGFGNAVLKKRSQEKCNV